MTRTEKSMTNLYSGLGYEYYTASLLWRMGFEAYKVDADFGFDIMVNNQKQRSYGLKSERECFLFQVKSRKVFEFTDKITKAGARKRSQQSFEFRKEDFEMLLKEENAYLVCHFIDATQEVESVIASFWLNNYQLKELNAGRCLNPGVTWSWFQQQGDKVILRTEITTQADSKDKVLSHLKNITLKLDSIKQKIDDPNMINKINDMFRDKKALESWITRSKLTNGNSNTNIVLFAMNPSGSETNCILRQEQLEFSNFKDECRVLPFRPLECQPTLLHI